MVVCKAHLSNYSCFHLSKFDTLVNQQDHTSTNQESHLWMNGFFKIEGFAGKSSSLTPPISLSWATGLVCRLKLTFKFATSHEHPYKQYTN